MPGDWSVSPELHSRPLMLQLQNNSYSVDTLLARAAPNETEFQFGYIPCIDRTQLFQSKCSGRDCDDSLPLSETCKVLEWKRSFSSGSLHRKSKHCRTQTSGSNKLFGDRQGPLQDAGFSKLAALLDRTSSQTAQSVRFHPGISELRS